MQTQNQNQNPVNILDQFSEMLKTHSIVVSDRDNLLKLFENIVDLCTQMPKTKLKAAIKAATPKPATEAKTKKPTAAAAKKKAVAVAVIADDKLVGPADAGDCPVLSDLPKVTSRGRGRPRKEPSASPASSVQTESSVNEAEKKKRGRPKKDKTVVVSSNDDEDQLIANMISDMKALQRSEDANTPVHIADPDDDESSNESNESSVSPIHSEITHQAVHPAEVETDVTETDVTETDVTEANSKKPKKAKEPKAPKETKAKEPKAPKAKESKAKAPKESKESKAPKESKATEPESAPVALIAPVVPAPASAVPPRENRAQSDGKFYLMHNCPRKSFTYNGATYLRTETDNVYDQLTLELIGVWDHLNHEIITAYDEEEDDIWMSDEE
jgi:hypothetical protein